MEYPCHLRRLADGLGPGSHPRLHHAGLGVLLSAWLLDEPVTKRRALGVGLGICGMLVLIGRELQAVGRSPLGASAWRGRPLLGAGHGDHEALAGGSPDVVVTAWQMLIGLVPILGISLAFEPGSFNPFALSLADARRPLQVCGGLHLLLLGLDADRHPGARGRLQSRRHDDPGRRRLQQRLVLGEMPSGRTTSALGLVVGSLATVMLPPRSDLLPSAGKPLSKNNLTGEIPETA